MTTSRVQLFRVFTAAVLATCLTSNTACGAAAVNNVATNTATIQQATEQLRRNFQDALNAIKSDVVVATLEPRLDPLIGECGPPTGTGTRGQQFVGYSNFIGGFTPDRNADVYAAIERFWSINGWVIYYDERPSSNSVFARSPDKYEMVIHTSSDGSEILSLNGNSPCVWPNGTATE